MNKTILFLLMLSTMSSFVRGDGKEKFLFRDDFKGDQASSALRFIPADAWKVRDGALVCDSFDGDAFARVTGNDQWRDCVITFKFKKIKSNPEMSGRHQIGVKLRGIIIMVRDELLSWYETRGEPLLRKHFEYGEWHELKLVCQGRALLPFLDGEKISLINATSDAGGFDLWCYNEKATFGDIIVRPLGPDEKLETASSPNILKNGSFEITSDSGIPDCWGPGHNWDWGLHDGRWATKEGFENWRSKWRRVATDAVDGGHAMKVSFPLALTSTAMRFPPPGGPFTVSAYVKADQKDTPFEIKLFMHDKHRKEFSADTEWRRYSLLIDDQMPFASFHKSLFGVTVAPLDGGTIWIDGVQFEHGREASGFQPSVADQVYLQAEKNRYNSPPKEGGELTKPELPPLRIWPDRSYYTSEKTGELIVSVNSVLFPSIDKLSVDLTIKEDGGKTVFNQHLRKIDDARMTVKFPVDELSVGGYVVDAFLYDSAKFGAMAAAKVVKLVSERKPEFKIDRSRRCWLRNGEPVIPVCPMWSWLPDAPTLAYLKSAGFDFIYVYFYPRSSDAQIAAMLDDADKNGIGVVGYIGAVHGYLAGGKSLIDRVGKLVGKFKDHPAITAWVVVDEPHLHPELVERIYQTAKILDPYHPVYVNYALPELEKELGSLPGDVVSLDYYPDDVRLVAGATRLLGQLGEKYGEPSFIILRDGGSVYNRYRCPTPAEQEFMSWISIINGSRGVQYFCGRPFNQAQWEKIIQFNKEIKELTPVLTNGEENVNITGANENVKFICLSHVGYAYVIALNASASPVKAEFDLAPLKPSEVEVMFENRRIKPVGTKFADAFKGFQRHVYKIKYGKGQYGWGHAEASPK